MPGAAISLMVDGSLASVADADAAGRFEIVVPRGSSTRLTLRATSPRSAPRGEGTVEVPIDRGGEIEIVLQAR